MANPCAAEAGYGFAGIGPFSGGQAEYLRVVEEVIAPLRRQSLIDGAYDKALVRLAGVPLPLRLLSPYESFSEEVFAECQGILREKYAHWLG